jgi:hypothetical protein
MLNHGFLYVFPSIFVTYVIFCPFFVTFEQKKPPRRVVQYNCHFLNGYYSIPSSSTSKIRFENGLIAPLSVAP